MINIHSVSFKSAPHIDNKSSVYESSDVFGYVSEEFLNSCNKNGNTFCANSLNDLNTKLRQERILQIEDEEMIKVVDDAFKKMKGIQEEKILFRSVAGSDLDPQVLNAKSGDVIIPDKGYAQVGLKQYYAEKYLPSENLNPVLFVMKFPKDSKVSFSKHTGTGCEEGMLSRNARFKVINKEKVNIRVFYSPEYYEDKTVTRYELEYKLED